MTPLPTWPLASARQISDLPKSTTWCEPPLSPAEPHGHDAQHEVPRILHRLKALRCLAAVAIHGSAVRAAEALFISQPAVTRAVLDFERFCGVALFDRGGRGMTPTAIGLRVARRAQAMLDHLASGAAAATELAAPADRRLSTSNRFAGAVTAAAIQALVVMARSRSEAQAALQLGISQPAVSRTLRVLEHLVGAPLLQRSLRGARFTESGETLLRHVKLACAEARGIECDLAAWHGEVRGSVVIGALPLSAALILPPAIDAVRRARPEIRITVVDGGFESLCRKLREADIDVMVGALRAPPPDIRQEVLFQEPLAVLARIGHPCFERHPLMLADLLPWEWVMPLHCTPATRALQQAFTSAGMCPPVPAVHCNNVTLIEAMLSQSDRLALTSRSQARHDERRGRVRQLPIDLPDTNRSIGVATRGSSEPSPDLAAVLDALRAAAMLVQDEQYDQHE